jgi:regulator of sirC expression with transglutaminase-like and TPR domain
MTPERKLNTEETRRYFIELVTQEADDIDLARCALLIAIEEQRLEPSVLNRYMSILDKMGKAVSKRLIDDDDSDPLEVLIEFLSGEMDFIGNQEDYYDPRNSFLTDVLDRRTGLPITLSIVYIEVGRRAGLEVEGVGLPGHFIIRVKNKGEEYLIDPFYGKVINEEDCQERLDTIYSGHVKLVPEHLRAVTSREILIRLLNNLKSIYERLNLHTQTLAIIERILLLTPQSVSEHRDRGITLANLKRYHEAIFELQFYLQYASDRPDAERVRSLIKELQLRVASFN